MSFLKIHMSIIVFSYLCISLPVIAAQPPSLDAPLSDAQNDIALAPSTAQEPSSETTAIANPDATAPAAADRANEISADFESETNETLKTAGVDGPAQSETPQEITEAPDLRPYGQGDMDLGIGLGGSGNGDSFTLGLGVMFAYYVVPRLGVGIDLSYQATWGDYKYPQSFTVFPLLKFVLVRSARFAPYLLTGGGRAFEWGGAKRNFDPITGEFLGYVAMSSWLYGVGGGAAIAIGARAVLNIQILAMYQKFDEQIYYDNDWTDNRWYPQPSFMLTFHF